jgi:membrane protein
MKKRRRVKRYKLSRNSKKVNNTKNGRSSEMFNKMKLMQIEKKDTLKDHYDVTKLRGFTFAFLQRLKDADISGFGAQLAYFFLLALFPLLIFLLTLLPYLNFPPALVYTVLEDLMPEQVYTMIEGTIIEVLENRNGGLLSLGIIGTIWSASNGVNALIRSLNRSYDQEETRPFLVARFVSVVFTLLLIILIIVALVLPVFGKQIGLFLFSTFGLETDFLVIWNKFRTLLPPILIFSVLTLMYWILPNIKLYLKSVMIGSLFATISWLLVSYAFSYYIDNFVNYSATYGSIGGIIILMLWLYLTGILLMVGGQLNAIMQQRREKLDRKNKEG